MTSQCQPRKKNLNRAVSHAKLILLLFQRDKVVLGVDGERLNGWSAVLGGEPTVKGL